jgi:hypothetical protein
MYDSKSETELSLEVKGKLFPLLCHDDWMDSFAFCTDITHRTHERSTSLKETITLSTKYVIKYTTHFTRCGIIWPQGGYK